MPKYLPLIIVFCILGFLFYKLIFKNSPGSTVDLKIGSENFNLETAKSLTQKAKGLSGRGELCKKCGMIFVYSNEGIYPFWMKDTLIPLDMIWVDSTGTITDIATASPQPNTPTTKLVLYKNTKPAKYIIELNANRSQEIGLKVGDQIWTNPPIFP